MLQNAYLLAKIGADTAENERNFAENLPKFAAARRMSPSTKLKTPEVKRDAGGGTRLRKSAPFRNAWSCKGVLGSMSALRWAEHEKAERAAADRPRNNGLDMLYVYVSTSKFKLWGMKI